MLRRTLLPITRNTAATISTPIIADTRPTSPVSEERRANQLSSIRTSSTPWIRDTRSRRVFSASVLWKSSFGTTMATAGSGFSSSISRAPPKPDQLRNSPSASSRDK